MTSLRHRRALPAFLVSGLVAGLVATVGMAPATASASVPVADPKAPAADAVPFVVLRENATGSATAAQKYIDQLIDAISETVGWPSAWGKYHTRRSAAESFIKANTPKYGILSLSAYLGMHEAQKLEAIGVADIQSGGGHQFFVVSKDHATLTGCKGKTLGTNHSDAAFIDKIASGDDFDLEDFEVVDTRRPVKTLKDVASGEVACAFVDDAQLMELQHLDGGLAVHAVWSSETLTPIVIAAFPAADPKETKAFKDSLPTVCSGKGKEACEATSMTMKPASEADLAALRKAYTG